MDVDRTVIEWLLDGDPAVLWQVKRDLLDAPASEVEAERALIATTGWGHALLCQQADDGSWGGGLYNPKWTSTFYTLLTLTALGLPPGNEQAGRAAALLYDRGRRGDGGLSFSSGTPVSVSRRGTSNVSELCITGMGLRMLSTFLTDPVECEPIARCLLEAQLPDGGWNCQRQSQHGSFNTTISALEGLREWSRATGGSAEVAAAVERGREFFLAHRLFKSHRTGEIVKKNMTTFTFPYHWHYDALRGLDYFQSVDAPRDERFEDAVALLRSHRKADARWRMQGRFPGHEYVVMEQNGEPSRWNTLRALRVLRWWQRS